MFNNHELNNNNNNNNGNVAPQHHIVIPQALIDTIAQWEPSSPTINEQKKTLLLNFFRNINTLEIMQVSSDLLTLSELIKENMTPEDKIKIYPSLVEIFHTIARSLYDNNLVYSNDIFVASNHLIDQLLSLNDPRINSKRLNVFKNLNNTYLSKFRAMVSFSKIRAIPSNPQMFSDLVTQELVNNMLRFRFTFENSHSIIDSLEKVIADYIKIKINKDNNTVTDLVIAGHKFKNMKFEQLEDFIKKCDILYKLLMIANTSEKHSGDLSELSLSYTLAIVADYWISHPLQSLDFEKQEPLLMDLLDIICDNEIKALSLLNKNARASFYIAGIKSHFYYLRKFFYEDHKHYKHNVPRLQKKLMNLEAYLNQIELLCPEIEFDIITLKLRELLTDLVNVYCRGSDLYKKLQEPQQQISFLFKVLASLDREPNSELAIELLMNAMIGLGACMRDKFGRYKDITIFNSFDEIESANFIKLLNRTKDVLTKIHNLNAEREYKQKLYNGFANFWENAIRQALKYNRYDLVFTATLFIIKELADNEIHNLNFKFDEFIEKIIENLNSCIGQGLESGNQEIRNYIVSNLYALVDYLIKETTSKNTLDKAENKVNLNQVLNSIVNALPELARYNMEIPLSKSLISLVIHSSHLIQKEYIVAFRISYLKQFCSQPIADDRIKEVNTFADACADYYFSQLSVYTNNNVSNNNNNNNNAQQANLSEDYLPVLRQIYKNLAAFYDKKRKLVMKLDCYNMLQEIDPENSVEYKKESNAIMLLIIKSDNTKLTDKIIYLEDIIANCAELQDSEGIQKAQKMLYDVKRELVQQYIDKRKFKYAYQICDELLKMCNNENIEEISALKGNITRIEEGLKTKPLANNNLFADNYDTHTNTRRTPRARNTNSQARTKKPQQGDALGDNQKQGSSRVEESTRPDYPGGKVGDRFEASYLSQTAMLFPVVLKVIPGFDLLKQNNHVLYRRLKRAALYKGACTREFGVAGVKYLGKKGGQDYWEAKVPRTKERLIGHTAEKDGEKIILFDTYAPKGLHKN